MGNVIVSVIVLGKVQLHNKNEATHSYQREAMWLGPEFPVSQIAPLTPTKYV